ncbi:hypothetical protein E2986_10776 [Frieseomelitta varia]|uniref:Uncharacterized protein n=1 Tax=Frieseomelitta varia TaxID=561572 RepID=A0A833VKS2_9HYME|nr:hypothetical protein E2986_10776 [Frieseomelitta varia]
MSRVRVRWQACVPASKQNHQGRVTGRSSERSSLPARAGTALEEKLPGTTVILVAVPAASALISSFATAGDTCKRALYLRDKLLGQPSRCFSVAAAFCLRSANIRRRQSGRSASRLALRAAP